MNSSKTFKISLLTISVTSIILLMCNATNTKQQKGTFNDERDGQTYQSISIGNQIWMAENLNYISPGSVCYKNDTGNAQLYGRLYPITEAKNSCPAGWHLPNDDEWKTLEKELGMRTSDLHKEAIPRGEGIAIKLKMQTGWNNYQKTECATNQSGFSARPGGFYLASEKRFFGLNTEAYFWTSTQENIAVNEQLFSTIDYKKEQYTWLRMLDYQNNDIARYYFSGTENYYSVRCVKNNTNNRFIYNGISVEIPEGWESETKIDKTVFLKLRVPKTGSYSFRPFINFTKNDLNGSSLESYYKIYMKSLSENKSYNQFKILSQKEIFIDSHKGIQFLFTAELAKSGIKIQSRITLFADEVYRYCIDCTSPPDVMDKYLYQFEEIEQSIKIIH